MYRPLAHTLWKPLSLLLAGTGLFLVYLLLKPVPSAQFIFGDNLLQGALEGLGLLLALPILFPASTRAQMGVHSSPRWLAWWIPSGSAVPLLIACALLSYVIGQGLWTLNEDVLHLAVLFPSWADAGYLGSYPFVLLAILFLPQQRQSLTSRTRIAFDVVITMTGVVTRLRSKRFPLEGAEPALHIKSRLHTKSGVCTSCRLEIEKKPRQI